MTKPLGPYTPVIRAGDFLVTSGQLGQLDGKLVDGGIVEETKQAMANLRSVLESEGASLSDVVKTTVFLADIDDWPKMNDPYLEALGDHRPARSAFAVGALPLNARVEIEAWAYAPPR
jgi:2-iminobutanoate/2-iminopropanoate deaminase